MRPQIIISALSILVISCGNSPLPPRGANPVLSNKYSSSPETLIKQVQDCSSSQFNAGETKLGLRLFLNGEEEILEKDFSDLLDGIHLRDPKGESISRTLYGEEYDFTHHIARGIAYPELNSRTEGTDLTICPSERDYPANSYEGAALNTAHYIQKVYDKATSLMPELKLSPISLKIGTLIKIKERHYVTKGVHIRNTFMVDNALYDSREKSIIFVPHSPEFRVGGFSHHYWQVPMVAAHEYGHHIFHSLAPRKSGLRSIISDCFDSEAIYSLSERETVTPGEVTNQDVIGSLNEGFADLIAFYSLSPAERSVNWVPRLTFDRDVLYSKFSFGAEKSFSPRVLGVFFSPRSPQSLMPGQFQDIHTMGAIFAHQAERFLENYIYDPDMKLTILMEWAKLLGQKKYSSFTPRNLMETALADFIRLSMKKMDKEYNKQRCQAIQDFYPFNENTFPECLAKSE